MTEEEAAVERDAQAARRYVVGERDPDAPPVPRLREKQMLKEAILELSPEPPRTLEEIPTWADSTGRGLQACGASSVRRGDIADIVAAVRGPIGRFGVDFERMRDRPRMMGDYIMALTPALLALVAERDRQQREEARFRQGAATDS
ncbi:MAG: hypothetical protein U5R14_08435 [Gemmatimonadota bacterium]|nr:hypothetical protein [Gemmatimonadota bacterium]